MQGGSLFLIILEVLTNATRQEKEIRSLGTRGREIKLFCVFSNNMITSTEIPKQSTY
jgi:hypothetical protein